MRHAESEANSADILASQINFPLSTEGHQDAVTIAGELKQLLKIDRIISSPLLRAVQTAAPFSAENQCGIELEPLLIEQHLGKYAGLTYAELETAEGYMHDRTKRWQWIPDGGGESYQMIAERVTHFFEQLDEASETVLVVTHAVTMRLIRAFLENAFPEYPRQIAHNGEIWKVAFTGSGKAHSIESIFLGESAHAASRA